MNALSQQNVDALVVGAGPVGLATAIALKQKKLSVAVIEQGRAPYDKACGEGIMPAGVEALSALGIDITAHEGAAFAGIGYIDGSFAARGSFQKGSGWAMRRTALVDVLRKRAAQLDIRIVDECRWHELTQTAAHTEVATSHGRWRADTVVAADGLHSKIRDTLKLHESYDKSPPRFGMRRHYACTPWSDDIEVHWADGAEAYVTPVGPQSIGVAILCGPKPSGFDKLLPRFAALSQRLAGCTRLSTLRGAGPLAQPVKRRYEGRVVLIGDAAGYLDALTGEGLTMGFLSALALADILAQSAPLAAYEAAYARLSAPYYREAYWLLALAKRPRLRRFAVRLMAHAPWLLQGFIAAHGARRFVRLRDFVARPACQSFPMYRADEKDRPRS
jgi:flavin-dependent dehydrogenase